MERKAQVDIPDKHGRTALHRAAGAGHLSVIQLLVQDGASLNRKDSLGLNAMHRAALLGHLQVSTYLQEQVTLTEDAHLE